MGHNASLCKGISHLGQIVHVEITWVQNTFSELDVLAVSDTLGGGTRGAKRMSNFLDSFERRRTMIITK